jgi:hypothetical protein
MTQLDQAQTVIERHLVTCDRCGTNKRCAERIDAEQVFARYRQLPHRTPGLTRQVPTEDMPFGFFGSRE